MIPILYERGTTDFDNNGIGLLKDIISCDCTEERNGISEVTFKYPVTGSWYGSIVEGCVIKVKPNETSALQLYRIYKSGKPLNGVVTFNAQHISYDLSGIPIPPFEVGGVNAQQALTAAFQASLLPHNFTAWSDITTLNATKIAEPCSLRKLLGGQRGSILDVWGGEYEFDNFAVKLHAHRGADNGVTLRYGKNITDAKQERNIADCYTHFYPYAINSSEEGDSEIVELPEKLLVLVDPENVGHQKALTMDMSEYFDEDEEITVTKLRSYANRYIQSVNLGSPKINIKIAFEQLWNSPEYSEFADFERVSLCDTVTVIFEELGINSKAKIIKTEYDVLSERYTKITIGDAKSNLSDRMVSIARDISDEELRAILSETRLSSKIVQTEAMIETEVTTARAAESVLSTRIQQTADSIVSTVTAAIADISIGGGNLLQDTEAPSLTAQYAENDRYFSGNTTAITPTYISITDPPAAPIKYGARFVCTAEAGNQMRLLVWYDGGGTVPLINGNQYTFSCYARRTSGEQVRLMYRYGRNSYQDVSYREIATTWTRYSWQFTYNAAQVGDTDYKGSRIYIGLVATYVGTVEICGCQLESGNMVTAYYPSSLDTAARISIAESRITQTADDITAEVTRATNAENSLSSSLSLQAGRVDLLVQGSGSSASIRASAIADAINQSSVTINADRIDLQGYVTMTDLSTGGRTSINGANIQTGTVTATQIAAGAITASKLNITLGGRNYILAVAAKYRAINTSNCTYTYNPDNNGEYKIVGGSQGYNQQIWHNSYSVPDELKGAQVIFHADTIDATGANSAPIIFLNVFNSGGTTVYDATLTKSQKTVKFTMPSTADKMRVALRVRNGSPFISGETLTVRGLKLEMGDVETDWTPAPEDGVEYGLAAGTTTINGGCITTGQVNANVIDVSGVITAGRANIETIVTNKVTASYINALNIAADSITVTDSSNNEVFAASASGKVVRLGGFTASQRSLTSGTLGNTQFVGIYSSFSGSTTIAGTSSSNWRIIAGNKFGVTREGYVYASQMTLSGDSVMLLGEGTTANPYIYLGNVNDSHTSNERVIRVYTSSGNTTFSVTSRGVVVIDNTLTVNNNVMVGGTLLRPTTNNYTNLGADGYRWKQLYAISGTINTSDERTKTEIESIREVYSDIFDELEPIQYRRIGGDRIHLGLGARAVEQAILKHGLTSLEMGALCYGDVEEDGEIKRVYGLRYEEFIPLCIMEIQKLKAEVKKQREFIKAMEGD